MKYKIIAAVSAVGVLMILAGTITGLSVAIKKQKEKIASLTAQVEKSNAEKEAFIRTIEEYRNIEEKYNEKKPTVSDSLTSAAVDDFNSLLSLWLSDGND